MNEGSVKIKKLNEWGYWVEGEINEFGVFVESSPTIGHPIPWEKLTKLGGPIRRHLEALWAEVKQLKERVEELEEKKHDDKAT